MAHETRRMIEAPLLILDFDGTMARLAVDWPALRARLAELTRASGGTWAPDAGLDANLRRLRRAHGEALFGRLCAVVAEAERAGFDPASIHAPTVALLRRRGDRPFAVVSSNTRRALTGIFRDPAWGGLTPFVVGKEDVRRGKPDPEGLMRACRRFGVAPGEAVFAGDAPSDRAAAEAAGMPFVPVAMPPARDLYHPMPKIA
ncbi:HAD family hydrolase [Rhodocaloribacter sp.]